MTYQKDLKTPQNVISVLGVDTFWELIFSYSCINRIAFKGECEILWWKLGGSRKTWGTFPNDNA